MENTDSLRFTRCLNFFKIYVLEDKSIEQIQRVLETFSLGSMETFNSFKQKKACLNSKQPKVFVLSNYF